MFRKAKPCPKCGTTTTEKFLLNQTYDHCPKCDALDYEVPAEPLESVFTEAPEASEEVTKPLDNPLEDIFADLDKELKNTILSVVPRKDIIEMVKDASEGHPQLFWVLHPDRGPIDFIIEFQEDGIAAIKELK